jgi:hypothetical protein
MACNLILDAASFCNGDTLGNRVVFQLELWYKY